MKWSNSLCCIAAFTGCGDAVLVPRPETKNITQMNTPLPNPKLDNAELLVDPPSNEFEGTVAKLWATPLKRTGMRVSFPAVIVTANAGNGERMYVNDPELTDASGIEIERCAKDDRTCKSARPALGSKVAVSGTLFVNRDGGATIGKVSVTPDTSVAEQKLEPRLAYVSNVEVGSIVGNEVIRATLVSLVDTQGAPASFVVHDLTPADDQNGSFPQELDAQCGADKVIPAGVSCCPAGVGPKFYSFIIREEATGKLVRVGTGNYQDIDFSSFPCGAADSSKVLKLGDRFTRFGGIFDVKFAKGTVSPASYDDYTLVRL
jgi:hypothetical protein